MRGQVVVSCDDRKQSVLPFILHTHGGTRDIAKKAQKDKRENNKYSDTL